MWKILNRKTNKIIIQTLSSQVLELGLSFIRNLLLVRYVGLEVFGKYQYLVALLAIMDFGYASLDSIIRRYFSELPTLSQQKVLWSNLLFKITSYWVTGILVYIYVSQFHSELFDQNKTLFHLLLLYFFFNVLLNTVVAIAQSLQLYSRVNFLNVSMNVIGFFAFIIFYLLKWLSVESFILFYIVLNLISSGLKLFILYNYTKAQIPVIYCYPDSKFANVFSEGIGEYWKYFSPLLMSNFSGYIIQFVPSILLGRIGEFEKISYLEIIKKIFRFLHKIVPTTAKTMLPTIIAKKKEANFPSKWRNYVLSYISLSILIGMMTFLFSQFIMSFYHIQMNETVKLLFAIYCFYLSLGAWASSTELLVLTSDSTRALFTNPLLRTIYVLVGYLLISTNLTPTTLTLVTVSSTLVAVFQMSLWIYQTEKPLLRVQFYTLALILIQIIIMLFMTKFDLYLKFPAVSII